MSTDTRSQLKKFDIFQASRREKIMISYRKITYRPGHCSGIAGKMEDVYQSDNQTIVQRDRNTPKQVSMNVKTNVIVLIGRTGNGKSSTGNTLLGNDTFYVEKGAATSVTKIVCQSSFHFRNEIWTVYDVPGLFDSDNNDDVYDSVKFTFDMFQNFLRQVRSTGVHGFLLVYNITDRFRSEEQHVLNYYKTALGPEFIQKYGILVFTHGDLLGKENFQQWIDSNSNGYKGVYIECQGRACVVSNIGAEKREKSKSCLMDSIVKMIGENQVQYSVEMYDTYNKARITMLIQLQLKKIEDEFEIELNKIDMQFSTLKNQWWNYENDIRKLFQDIAILKQKVITEDRDTHVLYSLLKKITNKEKTIQTHFQRCCLM